MAIFRFFRTAAAAILDLLKFQIYNSQTGQEVIAKICGDGSNRCRDMAIYLFFMMAAVAILDFLKFQIFKGQMVQ